MLKVLFSKVLQVFTLAVFINTICFILIHALPGDKALKIAAGRYGPDVVTNEIAQNVAQELGLNRPLYEQYFDSLFQLLQFDLGYSLVTGQKIIDELQTQFGYSLYLALFAFILSLIISFPLGIYSGSKNNGFIDKLSLFFSIVFKAIPPFVLAIILIIIFSIQLNILPPAGFDDWTYFILPGLTLALALSAVSNRLIRESMSEVTKSTYFTYGKYKGLSNYVLVKRHALKNAFIPILAFLGLQSIYLIEGVVVVESLFAFPGIGHALVHAVLSRDVPMIQGTVLLMGIFFILINLFTDILSKYLDPRLGVKHD
ncbi:ABC transporter permease [Poseidonibacter ostreae]|jgi:ABC-type dipeptide/oligopeptide/nickel transport system permease component|uniref:ABC transporter permease subunit n=1 Tax=Poseidonibacter ostreae TaxID=2654171 RepID=A0A6L4WYQ2_9BACT|nr:ABC transporter permease [Poseidonibacter ostreae]KAB7887281.1 ABC transporter permease subunit [Poseidonibacter ostreae]KAB7890876.1 ABC transporter permease subunit [Poseidonibacter ostreae]KAB7890895.1 ABC transporter permease subunit [Poseidonibacter ostreae]